MAANRWAFGGIDLASEFGLRCTEVDGYKAIPPLKGTNVPVPSVPGQFFVPKIHDSRRLALILTLANPGSDSFVVEDLLTRLAKVFGRSYRQQVLTQYVPEGGARTALAEVVDWNPADKSQIGTVYVGTVDFELADPYFYASPLVATQAIGASPTDFVFHHPGDARGSKATLDFLGPISNPKLANLSADGGIVSVECDVAVAAGKHLIIDTAAWTATNDALGTPVNAIGSLRHSGASELFLLDPGDNTLEVTATSPGGSLTITFQPSYF